MYQSFIKVCFIVAIWISVLTSSVSMSSLSYSTFHIVKLPFTPLDSHNYIVPDRKRDKKQERLKIYGNSLKIKPSRFSPVKSSCLSLKKLSRPRHEINTVYTAYTTSRKPIYIVRYTVFHVFTETIIRRMITTSCYIDRPQLTYVVTPL